MSAHAPRATALDQLSLDLADGAAFLSAIAGPFRRAIRVHPRRGAPSGWGELAAVPWSASGRFHAPEVDPGGNLDYHTGTAYPQDAASQAPVALLDPRPGETIIDACAAPGSKSTQIGLALGDVGLLLCLDVSPPRRRILVENLARQGVACAVVTPMPLLALAERHPGCADGVLVDAPCSGHEPRSQRQVERMGERQAALLALAARLVRPGGRAVYSTCTPHRAENETVIVRFLAEHPGWTVEPVALPGCDADLAGLGGIRLWPQRQATEPFFACRLRAPGSGEAVSLAGTHPEHLPILTRWLLDSPVRCWRRGNAVLAASAAAAACALPADARGLLLGHGEEAELELDPWAAQAVIDRGASTIPVDRATAIDLWAGRSAQGLAPGALIATTAGAPLGRVGPGGRLAMPSRMFRDGLR